MGSRMSYLEEEDLKSPKNRNGPLFPYLVPYFNYIFW